MIRLAPLLVLLLAACATKPPRIITEPRPVIVERQVVKPLPAELTDHPPIPELPAGALTNGDLLDTLKRLQSWGADMAGRLREAARLSREAE